MATTERLCQREKPNEDHHHKLRRCTGTHAYTRAASEPSLLGFSEHLRHWSVSPQLLIGSLSRPIKSDTKIHPRGPRTTKESTGRGGGRGARDRRQSRVGERYPSPYTETRGPVGGSGGAPQDGRMLTRGGQCGDPRPNRRARHALGFASRLLVEKPGRHASANLVPAAATAAGDQRRPYPFPAHQSQPPRPGSHRARTLDERTVRALFSPAAGNGYEGREGVGLAFSRYGGEEERGGIGARGY